MILQPSAHCQRSCNLFIVIWMTCGRFRSIALLSASKTHCFSCYQRPVPEIAFLTFISWKTHLFCHPTDTWLSIAPFQSHLPSQRQPIKPINLLSDSVLCKAVFRHYMIPTLAQGQVSTFYFQSDPFTLVWTIYIKRWSRYIIATSYRVFPHIDTMPDTHSLLVQSRCPRISIIPIAIEVHCYWLTSLDSTR